MIIDLTRTLQDGQPGVSIRKKFARPEDGWNATTLELYSHTGTHLDAPAHFINGGTTIEQIPLTQFLGMAHLVDLTDLPPRALIEIEHLGAVAGVFQDGESLLLRTGWSRHFDDTEYFRGHFPRIGEDLAHWCVEHNVKMLGVEPPSVADVNHLPEVTRIHEILLGGDIVIVEGLVNLDRLGSDRVFLGALPLKIGGGDGTPCRAFAVEGSLEDLAKG